MTTIIDTSELYVISLVNNKTIEISDKVKEFIGLDNNEKLLTKDEKIYKSFFEDRKTYIIVKGKNNELVTFKISHHSKCKDTGTQTILLCNLKTEIDKLNYVSNQKYIDYQTYLPNKLKLVEDLENTNSEPKSITIIDIRNLRSLNDFYGYELTSRIVKKMKEILLGEFYYGFKIYASDYDHFFMVQKKDDITQVDLIKKLKDIQKEFESTIFETVEGIKIKLECSIGVSIEDKRNKLNNANIALRTAKRTNQPLVIYCKEKDSSLEYKERLEWIQKIEHALVNDDFIPYYQPIMNNKTLEVAKYEVLARMKVGDKIISPYFFIELSKQSNQYNRITKTIVEKAFKNFSGTGKSFSINLSFLDIKDKDFLEYLKGMIIKYKIHNQLVVELLEDETITDFNIIDNFIKVLREYNVKVSIDDFGSGFSNYARLLEVDIDYIKIDASFIKNINKDKKAFIVVENIVLLAKKLEIEVVAEFVESINIYDTIKKLGIEYSQGYCFYEPLESHLD